MSEPVTSLLTESRGTNPTGNVGHLVRLGPPGKGDTIHRSTCRYAVAHSNALRWAWADRIGFDNIDWDALRRHGIKPCGVCDPEALRNV